MIHDDGFVPKKSLLPSIEFRNKTFTESGLMELVRNLDDFELDSIFIKLRQNDESQITNLMMKYPNLNRSVLKKAQALILKGGE